MDDGWNSMFRDLYYYKLLIWMMKEPSKWRIFSWLKWRRQKPPEVKTLEKYYGG